MSAQPSAASHTMDSP